MSPSLAPGQPASIQLAALDHGVWQELQADLVCALGRHGLANLTAPSILILHDLLDAAVNAMHLQVFRQIVETDFGLDLDGNDDHLETLYSTETSEHGVQNIVRFCKHNDWHVTVTFPDEGDALVWVDTPGPWDESACQTENIIDAVGYRLQRLLLPGTADRHRLVLMKRADRLPVLRPPELIGQGAASASLGHLLEKLSYCLIQFSATGEIMAVSPSILTHLRLEVSTTSVGALAEAIPQAFYTDIIWGLALGKRSGTFENYRIRVRSPGADKVTILFNVSGYRDDASAIHSLWQPVSTDEGGHLLSEGSILSEVRINNITRKYVPQLVQEAAREAIRLGKTQLANRECLVAVLFCDIVGFTSYVESNADSESVIDTLNSILRRVAGSVKVYNGSIDKFMGDCVMALFNDPADAVFAACDMQRHAEDINSLRSRAGQQTLQLRIGIHWGEVVIGNVGTVERLDWTAIGDVVNTASRIEKGCHPGALLISRAMRDAIDAAHHARIRFGEDFRLPLKGKWEDLTVCYVDLAEPSLDLAQASPD